MFEVYEYIKNKEGKCENIVEAWRFDNKEKAEIFLKNKKEENESERYDFVISEIEEE